MIRGKLHLDAIRRQITLWNCHGGSIVDYDVERLFVIEYPGGSRTDRGLGREVNLEESAWNRGMRSRDGFDDRVDSWRGPSG